MAPSSAMTAERKSSLLGKGMAANFGKGRRQRKSSSISTNSSNSSSKSSRNATKSKSPPSNNNKIGQRKVAAKTKTNILDRKIDPCNFDDLVWLTGQIRAMAGLLPGKHPKVGIICGSGLGALAEMLEEPIILPFAQLPGFPQPGVVGHKGNLVFGRLGSQFCVCLQGRFHPYEHGMNMALCTMPVRLMALLGVHTLIVSNAAGGINPELKLGDLMILKDHVFLPGLMGHSPLVGLKDPRFGPRFVSLHDAYDHGLRKKAQNLAKTLGAPVKEGVYVMNGGPQYETAAECAFISRLGGDAVGMSTCHEVTVARQCGIRCFAFSLITNCASLDADKPVEICHEEVLVAARNVSQMASKWIAELVNGIDSDDGAEEEGEN